jgi:hypothetical protein
MPRSACSPSGTSGVVVSAASAPRSAPTRRGANGAEVEPVGRADIAPQYLAQMQRRAEGQRWQPLRLPRRAGLHLGGTTPAEMGLEQRGQRG